MIVASPAPPRMYVHAEGAQAGTHLSLTRCLCTLPLAADRWPLECARRTQQQRRIAGIGCFRQRCVTDACLACMACLPLRLLGRGGVADSSGGQSRASRASRDDEGLKGAGERERRGVGQVFLAYWTGSVRVAHGLGGQSVYS